MAYCGCRTCCGKLTWCFTVLFLCAAIALLVPGLINLIPHAKTLRACAVAAGNVNPPNACWSAFWANSKLWFILTAVGAACLLGLLFCLFFMCCCAPKPKSKLPVTTHDQFIASQAPAAAPPAYDTAPTGDQYAAPYQAPPAKV